MPDAAPQKVGFGSGSTLAIVARVAGVLDDTTAHNSSQQLGLAFSQPRIFTEGYDCLIDARFPDANKNCGLTFTKPTTNFANRGAITDQQARVNSSANPARIGEYYTIWMTGLGQNPGALANTPAGFWLGFTDVPVYGYTGSTSLLSAKPTYVGISPQYPGLYQVNFKLPDSLAGVGSYMNYPPMWPCGDYTWEISLDIVERGVHANLIQLPVAIKNGDVACTK
jgi:uncharacterized protein (TIGR03437 family)